MTTTTEVDTITGEVISDPASTQSRELMLKPDVDNWMAVYPGDARTLAEDLCNTEFMPKGLRGKPHAALGVFLFGREIGMSPISAAQGLYAVDGRVGLYAETMRAMVYAAGHDIRITTQDTAKCAIAGKRSTSDEWQTFTFTMQEARDAGLASKDNWKKYPADMLLARATARMCRAIFPDVIRGFSAAEELQDMEPSVTVTQVSAATPVEAAKPARVSRARKPAARPSGPEPEPKPVELGPLQPPTPAADDTSGGPELIEDAELVDDGKASREQTAAIIQHLHQRLGITDREERLYWTAAAAELEDRTGLASTNDLTQEQAITALARLSKIRNTESLATLETRDGEAK